MASWITQEMETNQQRCHVDHLLDRIHKSSVFLGIIVRGESGSGKTHFVGSLQRRLLDSFQFHLIECADLVRKEVGGGEKHMYKIFQQAKTNGPSIVVLENVDILFDTCRGKLSEALLRLQSALVFCIDDLLFSQNHHKVCVITTATDTSGLDITLFRAGRLDHLIDIEVLSVIELKEVFVTFFNVNKDDDKFLIVLDQIARKYSGRIIGSIMNNLRIAMMMSIQIDTQVTNDVSKNYCLQIFQKLMG